MRQKLTTANVEPRRRRDFWRASLSDLYAPLEVKDCDVNGFHSEIVSTQVERINVSRFDGVAQTIARPQPLIKSGHSDDYVAVIQLDGAVNNSTNGRETATRAGSVTLYDLSRAYELRASGNLSIIDVSIKRADLERMLGVAPGTVGLSIDGSQTGVPMIVAFFQSLLEHGHQLDEAAAARLAGVGIDLLATGFAVKLAGEPARSMSAATYLYRAKVFIEANLGESDLSVVAIAAALGISIRRLYAVFAEHELTIETYLWERRLERAGVLLRAPACDSLAISTIGYQVGFSDPAHLARRFRRRFATTASEYREEMRLQRAARGGDDTG